MGVFLNAQLSFKLIKLEGCSYHKNQYPNRKKHIDTHHQLIWDYIEDGTVKMHNFPFRRKLAELFTNNLSNGTFYLMTSGYLYCY